MTTNTVKAEIRTAARSPDTAEVLSVKHWSEHLFSFDVERPDSLRFRSGEFVMLGLMVESANDSSQLKPLLRAYSIASPAWDDMLQFYSIKVKDGPLTSRLQHINAGSRIVLRPKPVGTLVIDALLPAENLWLFATGTGVAPFVSIIRDPETYQRYNRVILTHTCRNASELDYGKSIVNGLSQHEILSDIVGNSLTYLPMTTREAYPLMGRVTEKITDGSLYELLKLPALDKVRDRCMVCGSLSFNQDMVALLEARGFVEGTDSNPGHYVVEKAFVG